MPHHIQHDGNPTLVAVDKDKHSTSAVRWSIEHLLLTNTTLILAHVKIRNLHNRRYPLFFLNFVCTCLFVCLCVSILGLCHRITRLNLMLFSLGAIIIADGSNGGPPEANDESIDEIFTHFRTYCARKKVKS